MSKTGYLLVLLAVFSLSAQAVDDRTVAGAVVGGVAGAVIGNQVNGKKGAVIGAAIGGVTGAVIANGSAPRVPVGAPVVVAPQGSARGEDDHGDEGEGHHDHGRHLGERKHHHEED